MQWLLPFYFCCGIVAQAEGKDMGFAQAVREMVSKNVNVQVQRSKVRAAEAQISAARGAFTPELSLKAEQQNSGGNGPASDGSSSVPKATAYTANAKWNLFRSGADVATLKSSLSDLTYEQSLLENISLQAEDQAAESLLNLIEKKMIVEALRRSETNVHHFLEIAQARFARSLLSREEMQKVALDESNAQAKRADAEIQLNDSRAKVEKLLGHDYIISTWPWEKSLTLDQVQKLSQDEQRVLQNRPDIRAARTSVESEEWRSRSLFRAMLPTFDLTYSVGETHARGHIISGWTGLATLTIPLWSGMRDYSSYRVQKEAKFAAESRLSHLERELVSSLKVARANYQLSIEQYQSRTRNLSIARHLLEQDAARFKIGRADANELNTDLKRVTDAEILALQGIQQAHLAYMRLLHASGIPIEIGLFQSK